MRFLVLVSLLLGISAAPTHLAAQLVLGGVPVAVGDARTATLHRLRERFQLVDMGEPGDPDIWLVKAKAPPYENETYG
jgi:hypothetical protein